MDAVSGNCRSGPVFGLRTGDLCRAADQSRFACVVFETGRVRRSDLIFPLPLALADTGVHADRALSRAASVGNLRLHCVVFRARNLLVAIHRKARSPASLAGLALAVWWGRRCN